MYSRRSVLKSGLFAGIAAITAPAVLTACGNSTGSAVPGQVTSAVPPPSYKALNMAVKADLPGTDFGVPEVFFNYPGRPAKTVVGIPGDGKPITILTQSYAPLPPSVEGNDYWKSLNKRLGSDLEVQIVPAADYGTKFSTVVAGDKLPDYFLLSSVQQMPQFVASTCVDLSDHLSGDAVLKYPNLANIPSESWEVGRYGGRLYGIPAPRGINLSNILYRRDDILAAKGITEDAGSFEDFVGICKEVTDAQANVWANAVVPMDFIRQSLLIPNGWSIEAGKLKSSSEYIEEQETALEAGRRLVTEGLVNPDAFSSPQGKKWFNSGSAIFIVDSFGAWKQFWQQNVAGQAFDIGMQPVPRFDGGGEGVAWRMTPTYWCGAINKSAADRVETILKVANYLAAPFGSEEYLAVNFGEPGIHYALNGTDPALTPKGTAEKELGLSYISGPPIADYLPDLTDSVKKMQAAQIRTLKTAVSNPTAFLYSPTATSKGSGINKALSSLESDILQGRKNVSEWKTGVETWLKNGGEEIRGELEKAYTEAGRSS